MTEFTELAKFILNEIVHLAPWFLVAIVIGVAVQKLSIDVLARRSFARRGILGIAVVTAIGAFSPFCSFTVIPLIRRFLVAGVPLSAVMAFWVASPSMDPEIFALSASQLGLPIAVSRLIGALVLSFGSGLIVLALEKRGLFANPLRSGDKVPVATASCSSATVEPQAPACSGAQAPLKTPVAVVVGAGATGAGAVSSLSPVGGGAASAEPVSACSAAAADAASNDFVDDGTPWRVLARRDLQNLNAREILKEVVSDTLALGKWLLLAIVLEAIIVKYVPASFVSSVLGVNGVASVAVAGLISVPLYLNGVGAIPVVHGLLEQGMLSAAGVTFLLGGAITTIPAMVAVRSVVNGRVFAFYLGVGLIGSIGIGLVLLPLI